MAAPAQGTPTFKLVLVGDGGTGKVRYNCMTLKLPLYTLLRWLLPCELLAVDYPALATHMSCPTGITVYIEKHGVNQVLICRRFLAYRLPS